jgi:hypothetical protein
MDCPMGCAGSRPRAMLYLTSSSSSTRRHLPSRFVSAATSYYFGALGLVGAQLLDLRDNVHVRVNALVYHVARSEWVGTGDPPAARARADNECASKAAASA